MKKQSVKNKDGKRGMKPKIKLQALKHRQKYTGEKQCKKVDGKNGGNIDRSK